MQDLQKLGDKLVLLEDLVKNEEEGEGREDTASLLGLLNNPTIGQMYRACRDEIPKLLELANSNLNEDLMNKIINITERLTKIKNIVEVSDSTTSTANNDQSRFELKQSSDEIRNIFDDLPQLSSPSPDNKTESHKNNNEFNIEQKEFRFNNDLLIDLIHLSETRHILRVMNISSKGNTLIDVKIVKLDAFFDKFNTNLFFIEWEIGG